MRKLDRRSDTLNPLDFIDRDSPDAIDQCRDLAEQLVIKTGEEKEPHWNEAAEMWIAAAIAAVVFHAERDDAIDSSGV
jgi:type IV secretion system protein VirD4